jgi:hypothetical protein
LIPRRPEPDARERTAVAEHQQEVMYAPAALECAIFVRLAQIVAQAVVKGHG